MQTLTGQVVESGLSEHVLTDALLARLLDGSDQRRHHLVNRAMKAGELIRVRRGLYVLPKHLRSAACHPFVIAQAASPGSYISLETALSFHGWIPEAVYTTTSIVPGRKTKTFESKEFGQFEFYPLATQPGRFMELVERTPLGGRFALVAKPIRALLDLVYTRKLEWQGVDYLEASFRIEPEKLNSVTGSELRTLKEVYKNKRAQTFIVELERALGLALGSNY